MLFSIYFPFSDFRSLISENFRRLEYPKWPSPDFGRYHVRGIGSIRKRPKSGFEGWVGEDRLAVGVSAIALQLPKRIPFKFSTVRLIRKACFFDGLLNGRVELLFGIQMLPHRDAIVEMAEYLLQLPCTVARLGFKGFVREVGPSVGTLWAQSTTKHGDNFFVEFVRTGRPVCVVESDSWLDGRFSRRKDDPRSSPNIELSIISGKRPTELILIWPGAEQPLFRRDSEFRRESRTLRTYTLRLLQNVEALSLLLGMDNPNIPSEKIQNVLNEYTRQINRSRQRIQQYHASKTIEYCYSAFLRLYPGRIESVRTGLHPVPKTPS
jgi:hypothetical protein